MRGDHTQWPPITRLTMPSWAKRFSPRSLRSPMPSEWITLKPRGWPVARKRFSTASCRQLASTRPPPPPISATVSPSRISATASSALVNLVIGITRPRLRGARETRVVPSPFPHRFAARAASLSRIAGEGGECALARASRVRVRPSRPVPQVGRLDPLHQRDHGVERRGRDTVLTCQARDGAVDGVDLGGGGAVNNLAHR